MGYFWKVSPPPFSDMVLQCQQFHEEMGTAKPRKTNRLERKLFVLSAKHSIRLGKRLD